MIRSPFLSSGLDSSKFVPSTLVNLQNVSPQGFWEASLDGVSVNGTDLGLTGRTTILDTGKGVVLHIVQFFQVLNENTHTHNRHDIDDTPPS